MQNQKPQHFHNGQKISNTFFLQGINNGSIARCIGRKHNNEHFLIFIKKGNKN